MRPCVGLSGLFNSYANDAGGLEMARKYGAGRCADGARQMTRAGGRKEDVGTHNPPARSTMKAPRYRPGTTNRITVTSVREDACTITTDTPENLLMFWREIIATQPDHEPDKESVVVVMMNTRLRPYAWHRVSLGTVNESPACPREIFRPVIAAGAYGFAMMHNHPSGDCSPSRSDESTTRRIVEAANLLQIRLIDHVIVGESAPGRSPYYSFREAGLIA